MVGVVLLVLRERIPQGSQPAPDRRDAATQPSGDIAEMDLLAQALHEAEETRDQAILYLEQREAELMEQAAQTEAELRATSDSLKDARREVDDLTSYIARIKAKT